MRHVLPAILAICLAASPASAWQAAQQRAKLSASQLFELAERARSLGRNTDAEAIFDALSHDPDPEIRAEARFRKGMMFVEQRRYKEAAVTFRALLDEKPNATRVRLELARVLALLGDERDARREIRQAQSAGLPPDVALVVDKFASAIRSPKRVGGSLEIGIAPDSNINRATEARTLDTILAPLTLSPDARARSGVGLDLSGQAYGNIDVGADLALIPRISGRGLLYRQRAFNDISGAAQIGLQWRPHHDRVTPSVGESLRWFGPRLYARTTSLSVEWLHVAGKTSQIETSLSAGRAHYLLNPLQDGIIYDATLSYEHAFSPRSGGSITAAVDRQSAQDPGYATLSGGGSILFWRETGKATLFANAGLRRLEGDARLFLFPKRRREWLWQMTVGGTFRQLTISGFAPVVRLRFERNQSTVGIYDYRRVAAEIGITRAF